MQIDKSIEYEQTIRIDEGYSFHDKKKLDLSWIGKLYDSVAGAFSLGFTAVFGTDLGVIRIVILVSTVAC